jgi:predicted ester cyclase
MSFWLKENKVVACLTYTGTHQGPLFGFPATGKRVSYEGVAIFTLRDGRVMEGWVLGDAHGLREQLADRRGLM